jgi:small subunit ribosomal protein S1
MVDHDGGDDFGALFEESQKKGGGRPAARAAVGEVVRGRVMSIGREAAFLTLADGQTEGMIPLAELRDDDGKITVAVGDQVEARVVEVGDRPGFVVLRRMGGRGAVGRTELEQAFQTGLPVEGTVTGVNKGGLEVTVAGVRAFCPISQVALRPFDDPGSLVGQKLTFRITKYEVDRRGLDMVLSRRALLEEEARARRVELRGRLSVGAVLPGVVTAIKEFGAFVDIGGVEGMLPASELGFARGARPAEVLAIGQRLEVQVLRMETTDDPRRPERISLSLKSLARDPWEDVPTRFPPGTRAAGRVVRVEPYGAFIELAPGIEGLAHVGELGAGRQVRHARDLIKEGEVRQVTVLAVDLEKRRISLGVGEGPDEGDPADVAAAGAPGKLGTLGDLLKRRL